MITETFSARRLTALGAHRVDSKQVTGSHPYSLPGLFAMVVSIAIMGFFVISGSTLQPDDGEARLGLAAGQGLAPFGQVMGGWDPVLAPGRVMISQVWRAMEGGPATAGSIRGPEMIAALFLAGLISLRLKRAMGTTAGLFGLLATVSSLEWVDRSAMTGLDLVTGLFVFLAMDRLLTRGADWMAGIATAMALALGGWPAILVILLPIVLLGRKKARLSLPLLAPSLILFSVWSFWAIATTRPAVWATALTLPLMKPPALTLGLNVFVMAMPWSPLALVAFWPSIRSSWNDETRLLVKSWAQVSVIALLAGSLIPGLATASKIPVMVSLVMASSVILAQAWSSVMTTGPRRSVIAIGSGVSGAGGLGLLSLGVFLAIAQPYYRGVGIVLIILGGISGLLALDAVWIRASRQVVRAMIVLAIGVKVAHGSFYAPELNYRFGQGPWGRAIGQHVPPNWPIYVFHPWSPALALATEHPFRQLPTEVMLKAQPGGVKFVLLQESEFKHWPEVAPAVVKVREFEDERGRVRILARTPGRLIRRVDRD